MQWDESTVIALIREEVRRVMGEAWAPRNPGSPVNRGISVVPLTPSLSPCREARANRQRRGQVPRGSVRQVFCAADGRDAHQERVQGSALASLPPGGPSAGGVAHASAHLRAAGGPHPSLSRGGPRARANKQRRVDLWR